MPSWSTVDDLVLPKQVAGHPALELVNTRAGWGEPYVGDQDYLATLDHLTVLARVTGLLPEERTRRLRRRAARDTTGAASATDRARRLRGDLHDVLVGSASRAAARRLAEAVTDARSRQVMSLEQEPAGWRFPGPPSLTEPLDAFLVSAGELLVDRRRVDACPGHDCGWLFVNPSGRRRWCQMSVCGNRAKQATHQTRRRG